MQSFHTLLTRSRVAVRSMTDDDSNGMSNNTIDALVAMMSIVFLGLLLSSTLLMLRKARRARQVREMTLPQYNSNTMGGRNAHGLTIQTTNADGRQSVVVFNRDGQPMLANPHSPPHSPDNVPEIRITFPDEHDESSGRWKSGRVVVVRVGETTVGMEPLSEKEESLPAYEKDSKSSFYTIDMDTIGGLKEKGDHANYH